MWHRWFKEGWKDVHDDARRVLPKTKDGGKCEQDANSHMLRSKIEHANDDRILGHEQGCSATDSNFVTWKL